MHAQVWIFKGPGLNQISLPIFILMAISIYKENRILYSFSFASMGALAIVTLQNVGGLTAALAPVPLFWVALDYYSKPSIIVYIAGMIPSAWLLNYFVYQRTDYFNLPVAIIGNFILLTIFYFKNIKQPSNIDHLSKVTPLSKRQLLILKYLAAGVSRKEMPDKIQDRELWKHDIDKFSFHIINSEIADIKTRLDIESEFELGIWYNKKTEIPIKPSKT